MTKYAGMTPQGEVKTIISSQRPLAELQHLHPYSLYPCPENVVPGYFSRDHGETFEAPPEAPHAHALFNYETHIWETDNEKAWKALRDIRNKLLADTDWTELPSASHRLSPALQAEFLTYRQRLRDITETSDPMSVIWPTKPVA